MAQVSAPRSQPAKRWFLAPSLIGWIVRSTVFESISTRPSLKKRLSPFPWRNAQRIASASADLAETRANSP
jgi:hypothetical protein